MGYLFKSKKSVSMGLPLAFWSLLGGVIAYKFFDLPELAIAGYFVMMGLVVCGHMIAYGLSDAASVEKQVKE